MDFAAILLLLIVISGGIWIMDSAWFAPKRRAEYAALQKSAGDAGEIEKPELPWHVDYAKSFLPIFIIVLLLRSFLVEPFRIPSNSMMPTLLTGDFILVNKYNYGIRLPVLNVKVFELGAPERGDVVVFRYPVDPSTPFIKRVVGLPGDHVSYYNKILYINGKPVEQKPTGTYIGKGAGIVMTGAEVYHVEMDTAEHDILLNRKQISAEASMIVPAGHYFVLGDNRDHSHDSRFWGTVPDENLIGRAFMIWMNWDLKNSGIEWGRIGSEIK